MSVESLIFSTQGSFIKASFPTLLNHRILRGNTKSYILFMYADVSGLNSFMHSYVKRITTLRKFAGPHKRPTTYYLCSRSSSIQGETTLKRPEPFAIKSDVLSVLYWRQAKLLLYLFYAFV